MLIHENIPTEKMTQELVDEYFDECMKNMKNNVRLKNPFLDIPDNFITERMVMESIDSLGIMKVNVNGDYEDKRQCLFSHEYYMYISRAYSGWSSYPMSIARGIYSPLLQSIPNHLKTDDLYLKLINSDEDSLRVIPNNKITIEMSQAYFLKYPHKIESLPNKFRSIVYPNYNQI